MEHPYRQQHHQQQCALCKEPATGECRACCRPVCTGHGIYRWRWCEACEEGYAEYLQRLRDLGDRAMEQSMVWLYLAFVLCGALLCGAGALMTYLGLDPMITAISICIAGPSGMLLAFYVYARLIRQRSLRRRYLRKVKVKGSSRSSIARPVPGGRGPATR